MERIGFVGLGHMGGNMAARFIDAGYAVHGTARSRERAQGIVDQGLRWVDTPRAVAEDADIVFTSLPDDDAVRAVAAGDDGLLAGLGRDAVWADLSTISPDASRDLAARTRDRGGVLLDAPVSGSVPQVREGTLTILVGGDPAAYERLAPIVGVLGTPHHIGDNGQGLVLKLAINLNLAVQMLAFSEGLTLARNAGLDPHLAATVMTSSAIGSPMLKARVPLVLDRPDETWFDIALMRKDIGLALDAGDQLATRMAATGLAADVLDDAVAAGMEHRDIAAMYDLLEGSGRQREGQGASAVQVY
jgi:3-hydroxyisobutyrate dehydrogenase